jgi:Subtilase family/Bacterial pre-peptidase C-terminal domain
MGFSKKLTLKSLGHCLLIANIALGCSFLTSCGSRPAWMGGQDSKKDSNETVAISAPEVTQTSTPNDPAFAAAIVNNAYLLSSVNLNPWIQANHHGQSLTIAIFDNGFGSLKLALGKRLPENLSVEKSPIANESVTTHGTILAEIIFAMTSGSPRWTQASQHPTLKLYNTNGFTNLSAAVDQAIADHVDMIVYSQVWEFGGNFDGRGFINAAVNKATNSGILWINAAGNYAASSWQGKLVANADQSAALPYSNKYVRLVVKDPSTSVKISLSWNDFTDSKTWMTPRDLDLYLLDSQQKVIASSHKIQDGKPHDNDANYSAHAREVIETTLQPGTYLIQVDIKSNNFDSASSLRIAADGANISFTDQSTDASVMIPADNPTVLTVGASDDPSSSYGRTQDGILKPEVVAPSIIEFETGLAFRGSSTAAAVAAAALAVYQDACGKQSRSAIVAKIQSAALSQQSVIGRGLWLPGTVQCP